MKIGFFVRKDFPTASPYEGIASVEDSLLDQTFVVVLDQGRYVGILAADDLVRAPRTLVADCLRAKPRVEADTDLKAVLDQMREARTTTLPVFEGNRLVGVCVRSDIAEHLEAYRSELETEVTRTTAELTREIERRCSVEEELRRSEARYRQIVETAEEGIWVLDAEGCTSFVNRRVGAILGYDTAEILGRPLGDFLYDDEQARAFRGLPPPGQGECRLRHRDGAPLWFLVSRVSLQDDLGRPSGMLAMLTDVTEFKRLEERFHHAQKMEALGTLAGGIAHDFNNILTPIMGHAEMFLRKLPADSPLREHGEQVLQGAERARGVVEQILAVSRRRHAPREPVEPGLVIREVARLLRASFPSTIEIREHLEAEAGLVLADPTQLHQVLMNLCTNARHAMRETGGVLELRLSRTQVTAEQMTDVPAGDYVRLSVRDSGCGMDPETARRVFEPYFTTKPPGEGSGLGLAVVHGIVSAHGGTVVLQSDVGHGSTFELYLPRLPSRAHPGPAPAVAPVGGTENILFVDDEPRVVQIGESLLSSLGYRVTACGSAPEALQRFLAAPLDIDLVITDQTVPQMTGADLTVALLRIRPDVAVIIATGYSEDLDERRARELGARALLLKPFNLRTLARTVRAALRPLAAGPSKSPSG